jgi:hypothetical protein
VELKKKKHKVVKITLRTFYIVSVLIAGALLILLLMLTKTPRQYQPLESTETGQVHQYLTHYLAPQFYNEIQLDKPFEVIIPQKELNEMIVDRSTVDIDWPVKLDSLTFSAPAVVFYRDTILLMGRVGLGPVSVVVSVVAQPKLDESRMLWLNVQTVRVGTLNVTAVALVLAKGVFKEQIERYPEQDWIKGLASACQSNEPYEPVFDAYESRIRLISAEIEEGRLTLRFEPEPGSQ